MPRPSRSGATAAATTNAFSRRVSEVGRPVGETEASSHPAKKCVTGLMAGVFCRRLPLKGATESNIGDRVIARDLTPARAKAARAGGPGDPVIW